MLKYLVVCFLISSPAFGQFLREDEQDIQSAVVHGNQYLVLEDFLEQSAEPANVLSVEQLPGHNKPTFLVQRGDSNAILLPASEFRYLKLGVTPMSPLITFANTCQSECAASGAGGALTGAVAGGTSGTTAGATFGPYGAAGGLVLGGAIGMIGGGITGYELCRIATHCSMSMTPSKSPGGK